MGRARCIVKRFFQEEEGATAVEYAVMLVLIIVVCVAAIAYIGGQTNNAYTATTKAFPT